MGPCCHPEVNWGKTLPEAVNAVHPVQQGCSVFEIPTGGDNHYKILVWVDDSVPKWSFAGFRGESDAENHYFHYEIDPVRHTSRVRSISRRAFEKLFSADNEETITLNGLSRSLGKGWAGIIVGSTSFMDDISLLSVRDDEPLMEDPDMYFFCGDVRFVAHFPSFDHFLCSMNSPASSSELPQDKPDSTPSPQSILPQ